MSDRHTHRVGCQGIKTQNILIELWESGKATAEQDASVLSGLSFIKNWLTQTRAQRKEGRQVCTEHDHSIPVYHATENGWRITYDLTRLSISHPDPAVLEKTKELLGDGNLSPYHDVIIVCCCITD